MAVMGKLHGDVLQAEKGQTVEKVTSDLDLGVIHIQVRVKPSEKL